MQIKGLPEGVDIAEIRVPVNGDLVFFHGNIVMMNPDTVAIYTPELILTRAPGYAREYDITTDTWKFVKKS